MRILRQRRFCGNPEQVRGWTSLHSLWRVSILDTLRRFWDKLCEAGTLRSDSGASLKAVGIPSLQGGEDVKNFGQEATYMQTETENRVVDSYRKCAAEGCTKLISRAERHARCKNHRPGGNNRRPKYIIVDGRIPASA